MDLARLHQQGNKEHAVVERQSQNESESLVRHKLKKFVLSGIGHIREHFFFASQRLLSVII